MASIGFFKRPPTSQPGPVANAPMVWPSSPADAASSPMPPSSPVPTSPNLSDINLFRRGAWEEAARRMQGSAAPTTAATPPHALNAAGRGVSPQQYYQDYLKNFGVNLRQSDPSGWNELVQAMNTEGYPVSLDQRTDNLHKGIMLNGQFVKLLNGLDQPIWEPGGGGGWDAGGGLTNFTDPSSQYMNDYYKQILDLFQKQSAQQEQANAALRARMPDIQAETKKLIDYLNQRATSLQGAPYTGTEAEILRTQALDPIEADRQAAKQRALQSIGARGLTPESGIAQALMNQVDAGYDRSRAGAQNELAYRTINEQRSRQQEAQQLLGMVPQIERAGATGDLQFLQALDQAVASPLMQGTPLVSQLQQLPSLALRDANMMLGQGPNAGSAFQQAGYLNQMNQGNDAAFWQQLFAILGV